VPVADEPRAAEGDERATYDPSERLRRHDPAEGERREDRGPDRERVAQGQGRERAPHRARPPFLQPEGNGEEPAHPGIYPVHRAQTGEREPSHLVHCPPPAQA